MKTLNEFKLLDAEAAQGYILNKNQQKSIIGGYIEVCCYWEDLTECGTCADDDIETCNSYGPKYDEEMWGAFLGCYKS
jgi:hypothetical protein